MSVASVGGGSCTTFDAVANAGIPGFNDETVGGTTLAGCQQLCTDRPWCKSVDYERATGTCYVQSVGMTTQPLRRDYPGDPYDHYSCAGAVESASAKFERCEAMREHAAIRCRADAASLSEQGNLQCLQSAASDCLGEFHACYRACGGQVVETTVCVSGCE